ncbi:MAG TPA: hypothetical protein VG944_05605 [Fimbriimonas sp.]|nr:hypothetical protein [Fimbriimonas sp.]
MSDESSDSAKTADRLKIITASIPPISDAVYEKAKTSLVLMPEDWTVPDLIFANSTESVLKVLKQGGAAVALPDSTASVDLRDNRSDDWVSPTILVTQLMLSQNPLAVSVATNLISSYVFEFFKGRKADPQVKLRILRETDPNRTFELVEYSGPASGLSELPQTIDKLNKGR